MTEIPLAPIHARHIQILKTVLDSGGELPLAELRKQHGALIGHDLHSLRNRSLIEAWMDIVRVTETGRHIATLLTGCSEFSLELDVTGAICRFQPLAVYDKEE